MVSAEEHRLPGEGEDGERRRDLPEGDARLGPEPGPRGTDQVNFTDPESRIMPASGGGFEQS